jgi:hypothetical protein
MIHLFIGGTLDGQRIDVRDKMMEYCAAVPQPIESSCYHRGIARPSTTHRYHIYRREIMRCNQSELSFYVLRELSIEAAIEQLFEFYKPKEQPQKGHTEP